MTHEVSNEQPALCLRNGEKSRSGAPLGSLGSIGALGLLGLVLCSGSVMGDVIYQQDFEHWTNADGMWSSDTQASLGGTYTNVLGRFGTESVSLTIAAPADSGGGGTEPGGGLPFNLTIDHYLSHQSPEPRPDGQGGGGQGGPIGDTDFDLPSLDLGGAISDSTSPGASVFGPGKYSMRFDIMAFDSWDGTGDWGPDTFSVAVNGVTMFDEVLGRSNGTWEYRRPDERPDLNAFSAEFRDSIYRDVEIVFELTEVTDVMFFEFTGTLNQAISDESWGLDNVVFEKLPTGGARSEEVPAPSGLLVLGGGLGLMSRRKRS
ncbi:MAG: hypothetical protein ACWA5W_07900 [Phycisphaerales bacterium]